MTILIQIALTNSNLDSGFRTFSAPRKIGNGWQVSFSSPSDDVEILVRESHSLAWLSATCTEKTYAVSLDVAVFLCTHVLDRPDLSCTVTIALAIPIRVLLL
jgi:hypothetical protein